MNKYKKILMALSLTISINAQADIYRFEFSNTSTVYAENGANLLINPTATFAYLDFDTSLNQFRLYDNTNDNYLSGQGSDNTKFGITGIAFNFGANTTTLGSVTYIPSIYNSGLMDSLSPTSINSVIANAGFDSAYATLQESDNSLKLNNGESVTFAISGFDNNAFSNLINSGGLVSANSIAVRVSSSLDGAGGLRRNWFAASSVAAVPEPTTYAMFLAGLGLLGFASRKREAE